MRRVHGERSHWQNQMFTLKLFGGGFIFMVHKVIVFNSVNSMIIREGESARAQAKRDMIIIVW